MGWLKYATALGGLVGLALCVGLIAELALERRDASRYPPPGLLVDAGGYRMHVHCTGDGPVPLILISGLGGWSQDWSAVQPLLSRTHRTCSFDRAGYGWSEEAGAPRIGMAAIEDMRTAFNEAGVGSPRIVVGHSLGGLLAQIYAQRYPTEVAAMALLDSVERHQYQSMAPATLERYKTDMGRLTGAAAAASRFGVLRLAGTPASIIVDRLPAGERASANANGVRPKAFRALRDEFVGVDQALADALAANANPNFPVSVIGTDRNRDFPPGWDTDEMRAFWQEGQRRLGQQFKVTPQILPDAGHYVQIEQPQIVVDAVAGLVTRLAESN